jgi:uncharacterized protein YjiS (DUF1127 family)
MSTITHDQTNAFADTTGFAPSGLMARFSAWRAERRKIARITRELNTYTDRQLGDLGLCRSDIPDVAAGRIVR